MLFRSVSQSRYRSLGVTKSIYGLKLWDGLMAALGEDGFDQDSDSLIEFRDQEKKAVDYFFQQYYDEQQQEKEELHNLILAKQKEVEQLLEKLSQM